ncbi:transcriptional regulator sugar kinase [Spiroplasma clarkii]|uniref:ROK family sugar kinase n=1 Tax=Spiroplasma clarkii TaxID=2139 RepID=A0A1Y0L022_9MOLU|nr:ROK family protein [Spiroplasma clarkii]ARU91364.1 transcriptional regulator sugar kinase [Spiroplasma clarkii]ATX70782.1 ROK family sugar kinase [Spiroplasma clarkii]
MEENILTFDIGGMGIKIIKFNSKGQELIVDYLHHNHLALDKYFVKLTDLLDHIDEYICKNHEKVKVGICIPGIIDSQNFQVKSRSFILDWKDLDIKQYLQKNKLITNLVIENDAKAAAYGEFSNNNFKLSRKLNSAIIITIGSAIGGGIVIDEKIHSGINGLAGEFSKMYANLKWDDDAEAAGECSTMQMRIKYAEAIGKPIEEVSGKTIMEQYLKKDKHALKVVENTTTALAKMIFNINICIDTDAILIGGGISSDKIFVDLIKLKLAHYYEEQELKDLYPKFIESCTLENKAGCYGMFYKLVSS